MTQNRHVGAPSGALRVAADDFVSGAAEAAPTKRQQKKKTRMTVNKKPGLILKHQ